MVSRWTPTAAFYMESMSRRARPGSPLSPLHCGQTQAGVHAHNARGPQKYINAKVRRKVTIIKNPVWIVFLYNNNHKILIFFYEGRAHKEVPGSQRP